MFVIQTAEQIQDMQLRSTDNFTANKMNNFVIRQDFVFPSARILGILILDFSWILPIGRQQKS